LKFDVHGYLHEEQDEIDVRNVLGKSLPKSRISICNFVNCVL